MKIIFDLRKTGLGNNGGSSTLIHSGNTLIDMGHEVIFVDSMKNKHSWTPLKAEHRIIRFDDQLPSADVIISTGYKSVGPTVRAPKRCGMKMHWIRAWEHWQMSDEMIVKKVLNKPTIKIVNSICLQNKLKEYNVKSYIIRPGYDFDQLFPNHSRDKGKDIILGGLYREGIHGNRKRTSWILQAAKLLKIKYPKVKLWLFGSENKVKDSIVDYYLRSPSMNEKNKFYNRVDIWLAPTMSEGLHLPPAEAMLTECPVVSTKAKLSGTQDYVIDGKTGLMSENNFESFVKCIKYLIEDKQKRRSFGKQARLKILELGDRKENMEKLIYLIEELNEDI